MTHSADTPNSRPTNRLALETSPYLLQHQHNPVDWHAWGEEAFETARRENKPLLISIGYSACHWCHVMERESFEDPAIAAKINASVVPVKVDREERPDVDAIYMDACMAMTGSGGWPLNAFVTPDLKPIFVGTYFPPDNRYGRPGFGTVVERIAEAWREEGPALSAQAAQIHAEIHRYEAPEQHASADFDPQIFALLESESQRTYDAIYGGFGSAPKFPADSKIAALLAHAHDSNAHTSRDMALHTLDRMARGGLFDQIGGGFARYSVDEKWLIPHFEKMLYNQALMIPNYVAAARMTGDSWYARVATETADFVLAELTESSGMFYCALDADSEGEEGKFYAWTPAELTAVLGETDGPRAAELYNVTSAGNFEHGRSALWLPTPESDWASNNQFTPDEFAQWRQSIRAKLMAERAARVRPGLDDKCLVGWNGLMISAFAAVYQFALDARYRDAAQRAADSIVANMLRPDGDLLRCYCKGRAYASGVLEDYAYFSLGLLDLFEITAFAHYLEVATDVAATMRTLFEDATGGFFFARGDDPHLVARTREWHDGAMPSPNSAAALALLRLSALSGDPALEASARNALKPVHRAAHRSTGAFASALLAWRFGRADRRDIVITAPDWTSALPYLREAWNTVAKGAASVTLLTPENISSLALRAVAEGRSCSEAVIAYVCRDQTCSAPIHNLTELKAALLHS